MSADQWDARYRDAGLLWTGQANRFVAAELDGVAPGRALDLGCGEGEMPSGSPSTGGARRQAVRG